jgi:hypothetical protein
MNLFVQETGCQEFLTRLHTRMALDSALAEVNQVVRLIVIEECSAVGKSEVLLRIEGIC